MPVSPLYTKAVIDEVNGLINEANKSGARVAAWEAIKKVLSSANLSWTTRMDPDFCRGPPQKP